MDFLNAHKSRPSVNPRMRERVGLRLPVVPRYPIARLLKLALGEVVAPTPMPERTG